MTDAISTAAQTSKAWPFEEARKLGATRVFLMVSSTLNRTTDEIAKVKDLLGDGIPGAVGAVDEAGVIMVMKSAVVLPVGSGAPLSPVGLPLVWVVTVKLEKRATLVMPEVTWAPRPAPL